MSMCVLDRKTDNRCAFIIEINYQVNSENELMQMDVPLEYQDDDFSCTPVCMSMVLKCIKDRFTTGFPDLTLDSISKAIKTSADEGGTTFLNIENINELFKKTSPSLEIVPQFGRKFEEIIEEVKIKKRPVIAWVLMPDPVAPYEHSIVITDVNEDKLIIYCNDPVYGRVEIPTRQFIEMWNGCSRILIKFRIGEKVTLFDFP